MSFDKKTGVLTIEEGVTTIKENSLRALSAKTLVLPKSLKEISLQKENYLPRLEKVFFHPESTPYEILFTGNSTIKFVSLPNSLESIPDNCFKDCTSLEEVVLPERLNRINFCSFTRTPKLKKVTWPKTPVIIEQGAFRETGLESVKGLSVKFLEREVFESSALREVDITILQDCRLEGTFQECKQLEQCIIRLGGHATLYRTFKDCTSLEVVGMTSGVSFILLDVFDNCRKLRLVGLPSDFKIFGSTLYDSEVRIDKQTFSGKVLEEKVNVPAIAKNLREVESMCGDFVFNCCDIIELYNSKLPTLREALDNKTSSEVPLYEEVLPLGSFEYDEESGTLTLGEKITEINFRANSDICGPVMNKVTVLNRAKKIIFSRALKSIQFEAFRGCKNLEEVVFPEDCLLEELDSSVFKNCARLTSVSLPKNLKVIDSECFQDCKSLTSVKWPECSVLIEFSAFRKTGLREVKNAKFSEISFEAFRDSQLESVDVIIEGPNSIVQGECFQGCKNLVSVKITANTPTILTQYAITQMEALRELSLLGQIVLIDYMDLRSPLSKFAVSSQLSALCKIKSELLPNEIEVDGEMIVPRECLTSIMIENGSINTRCLGNYAGVFKFAQSRRTLREELLLLYPEQMTVKLGLSRGDDIEETSLF